ncbi:MAG: 3-deoxy-D-manno-octulosonate 8-phosphate phosphatase [Alphaproteobacteria bacterium]|nr:MAG: 3-deoxy-D-manno-octulosonate 8-phosphate phosphatase [Alphaproteobacteria bacterium]
MRLKLLALDVDGVLTDGTLYYTAGGEEMKAFNAQDGLGLKLLARLGIELAVLSGRGSAVLERRLDDLGISERRLHCHDKLSAFREICASRGVSLSEAAFMGDDLIDLAAMQACGFAIAPANAVAVVRDAAALVTRATGGRGAVREACEHIAARMGTSLAALYADRQAELVQ